MIRPYMIACTKISFAYSITINNADFSILKLAFTFISVANKTSFYAKVMSRKRLDICSHAALITPKQ